MCKMKMNPNDPKNFVRASNGLSCVTACVLSVSYDTGKSKKVSATDDYIINDPKFLDLSLTGTQLIGTISLDFSTKMTQLN